MRNPFDQTLDAITEYVKTSERVVKELMKPGGDPEAELRAWATCNLPVFTGVNANVAQASCVPVRDPVRRRATAHRSTR